MFGSCSYCVNLSWRLWRLAVLIIALSLFLSCECSQSRPARPESENFHHHTDGIGRNISVKAEPQRIISLAPNVTEILFALSLGDKVVGVTSYCDFPQDARSKEKIGDTLNPDLERIVALKPDLVVITTASQLEKLTSSLDQLGIPVYVTNPRTLREVVASIRVLGEVTGARDRARETANEMERRIRVVEDRVKELSRPSVFYVLQTAPLITAGRNTFINDLIILAGGQSISGDETVDYPQYSRESVISRAPKIIIAPSGHGTELVKGEDLRRDFAATPAIRNNRIVWVDPDLVDRPGPRIVAGLEQLAQGLHPESQ